MTAYPKCWQNQKNKSVSIICIGPSSNICYLLKIKPKLQKKLKEIIILGGVFTEKGNITPFAEFNVFNDPLSLMYLLKSECKKVIIPINMCRKVTFSIRDFNKLDDKTLTDGLKQITDLYIKYYNNNSDFGGLPVE